MIVLCLDAGIYETIIESAQVNPTSPSKMSKDNQNCSYKKLVTAESENDDIIVKELLDVQAATIFTQKATNKQYKNTDFNTKQDAFVEKPVSPNSASNLDHHLCTSTPRRGCMLLTKGILNQFIIINNRICSMKCFDYIT